MKKSTTIKAAFFDIDGTLRSMETQCILPSTIEALAALKKQGVKLFISTGRRWGSIPDMGIDFDGFITVNGSFCLTDTQAVLQEHFLPTDELNTFIDFAQKEKITCRLVTHHQIRCNFLSAAVLDVQKKVHTALPPVGDLKELLEEGVLQASVYADEEVVNQAIATLMPSCYASSWTSLFSDVNKKEASKQTGMDCLLKHYQIDLAQTIAFGDGGNDISMLRHAGIGVAMGNAQEHVKAIADYVTDTVDENGIANALKVFGVL